MPSKYCARAFGGVRAAASSSYMAMRNRTRSPGGVQGTLLNKTVQVQDELSTGEGEPSTETEHTDVMNSEDEERSHKEVESKDGIECEHNLLLILMSMMLNHASASSVDSVDSFDSMHRSFLSIKSLVLLNLI